MVYSKFRNAESQYRGFFILRIILIIENFELAFFQISRFVSPNFGFLSYLGIFKKGFKGFLDPGNLIPSIKEF